MEEVNRHQSTEMGFYAISNRQAFLRAQIQTYNQMFEELDLTSAEVKRTSSSLPLSSVAPKLVVLGMALVGLAILAANFFS